MAIRLAYTLTYLKVCCEGVVQYNGWLGIAEDDYVYAAKGYQNAAGGKNFLHQPKSSLRKPPLQSPHLQHE